MQTEASQHVVEVEGGEFAVMAPLEAGAGGKGHTGITGGPEGGRGSGGEIRKGEIHGEQVHGEAEMCWFQD